jgi:hypothetical protein
MTVQDGKTVYCRMRDCDFYFPLPSGARIQSTDPVTGGDDTIDGFLYVTDKNGGPVDLNAYAELMRKKGLRVEYNVGASLEGEVGKAPTKFNPPYGGTPAWVAVGGDVGAVAVETVSNVTVIGFTYFGDY